MPAGLGVVVPTDVRQRFLLLRLFLLLVLLGRLGRDAPLALPVRPHVGELVGKQEVLSVFPVQGIPTKDIVDELCEDGRSSRVPR